MGPRASCRNYRPVLFAAFFQWVYRSDFYAQTLLSTHPFTVAKRVLANGLCVVVYADLGTGVLDALVESAAFVLSRQQRPTQLFLQCFQNGMVIPDVHQALMQDADRTRLPFAQWIHAQYFAYLPYHPFAYWASPALIRAFRSFPKFEADGRMASSGASTNDDFRFLRLWWEVPPDTIAVVREETQAGKTWVTIAKGGEYAAFHQDF